MTAKNNQKNSSILKNMAIQIKKTSTETLVTTKIRKYLTSDPVKKPKEKTTLAISVLENNFLTKKIFQI